MTTIARDKAARASSLDLIAPSIVLPEILVDFTRFAAPRSSAANRGNQ
jgi:hypothetical protein